MEPLDHRPSWDEYFMTLANEVATRTTCMRRAVGAVIVKDRRILATGYNGVPTGMRHCAETGCLRQQLGVPSGQRHEICRGLYAEQNAIIQAAMNLVLDNQYQSVTADNAVSQHRSSPAVSGTDIGINALRLVQQTSQILQNEVRPIYHDKRVDRKLRRKIIEKKQAQGLRQ